MKKIFREKGNLNRPTAKKERKFDIRYGLPTLFHRVELAFVQQPKKHTYQFTGSQSECSFMLMGSKISVFLVIKSFVFRTVVNDTSGSFDDVVAQVTVTSFV